MGCPVVPGDGERLFESTAICHHDTNMDSVAKPFIKFKQRLKERRRKRGEGSRSDGRGGGEYNTEGNEAGQSSRLPLEAEGWWKVDPVER